VGRILHVYACVGTIPSYASWSTYVYVHVKVLWFIMHIEPRVETLMWSWTWLLFHPRPHILGMSPPSRLHKFKTINVHDVTYIWCYMFLVSSFSIFLHFFIFLSLWLSQFVWLLKVFFSSCFQIWFFWPFQHRGLIILKNKK